MDLNRIIGILELPNLTLRMYFTRKRGINYISYSPSIEPDLQNELIGLIKEYLRNFVEYQQIPFSPVGYREETIETCTRTYINSFDQVVNSFTQENVNREPLDDDSITKLNFYCLEVNYRVGAVYQKIRFFRRVTKFKKLTASGFFGFIRDNSFNKIEGNLLGIDGEVDIIEHEQELVILNHISLERIFSLADQYLEKAQNAIDLIRNADRINNFEQFESDCLNDRRMTRILTKMLTEETRLENCFENFPNVISVIEIFELDIDIDNSSAVPKIIYDNKEQLMDIIRLVRDSYYRSIINERTGIDDGI